MASAMMLPRFDFEAPARLEDACGLVAQAGDEARLLAGGTDLLVKLKLGQLGARLVVSLARIDGLDLIEASTDGGLRIGAMATMSQLAVCPQLADSWAALAEGAASVAGPIIRNRATVGGNIVNARPCADTAPALMVLGARLRLRSRDGERTVALDGFISGPGQTAIRAGEVLTGLELPPPGGGGSGSAYLKITRRAAMDVTVVGCAASVVLDRARARIERSRMVLSSVAPVPLSVPEAEGVLTGSAPDESVLAEAARAARRTARPIDDHRAPGDYRSRMVEVLARRALRLAVERAGGRVS